jgi:hypothetical protein
VELVVQYAEAMGVIVPERLREDSKMEINLSASAAKITLRIFSMAGTYIRTIVIDQLDLYNEVVWDLRDSEGQPVQNGPYLLVFEIDYDNEKQTVEKKAVMVIR